MEFVIEKSIPIPHRGRDQSLVKALRALEVGDSFRMPGIVNAATRVHNGTRGSGMKFKTRTEPDGVLRVWRIA